MLPQQLSQPALPFPGPVLLNVFMPSSYGNRKNPPFYPFYLYVSGLIRTGINESHLNLFLYCKMEECVTLLKGNSGMNKHVERAVWLHPQGPPSFASSPLLSFLGSGWERGTGRVTLKCNDFNSLRVPEGPNGKGGYAFCSNTYFWDLEQAMDHKDPFLTEGKSTLPYPSYCNEVPSLGSFFLSFEHRPGPSPEFNLTSPAVNFNKNSHKATQNSIVRSSQTSSHHCQGCKMG